MKNITLTHLTDPDKRIAAIKALREASGPLYDGTQRMGLREAKHVTDDLAIGQNVSVLVEEPTLLHGHFDFIVEDEAIDAQDVLDFMFAAVAAAPGLRYEPSFLKLRAAI